MIFKMINIYMKVLYTKLQFRSAKSRDKLPLSCEECNSTFYMEKHHIPNTHRIGNNAGRFCSKNCSNKNQIKGVYVLCDNCKCSIIRTPYELKSSNHKFCSQSCAATYNNTHKTKGNRRSKLEVWLETKLIGIYPNLSFLFNDKTTIGSELDIYIPQFKIAFELNGIFHYEPIYGKEKLNSIKNNDDLKFKLCQENNISLCIIDTSSQKYFKEKTSEQFLHIITNIINGGRQSIQNSPR